MAFQNILHKVFKPRLAVTLKALGTQNTLKATQHTVKIVVHNNKVVLVVVGNINLALFNTVFDIVLSITAIGSEPLAYQWSKGGVELEGATDSRLTLADVVPSDAGDYVVAVSNSAGRVESDVITVTMAQPASIVTQPAGGSVSYGETVTLNVVAAGTEPISYQWYHGDELVEGATESTLLLADLQTEDAGTYYVVVSNRAGAETSNIVTLTVEIQGPETEPTLAVVGITAEGLQLSVTGDAATEYELQFSTDLKSWSTLANVVTDDTGKAVLTDAASAETLAKETWAEATGFYRAVLVVGDGGE